MASLLDRLRCVQDVAVEGKRVVVRVDYNVTPHKDTSFAVQPSRENHSDKEDDNAQNER